MVEQVVHADSALIAEVVALAERFGNDEDIGENNGCIERESTQGLEGDFGGQFRGAHHGDEVVRRLEFAIFGEVSTGLPHEPDRRAVDGLAMSGGEETLAWRHGGGSFVYRLAQSCGWRKTL